MLNRRYLATQFQVSKAESKLNDERVLERAYDAGYRFAKREHIAAEESRGLKLKVISYSQGALMELDYRTDLEEEDLQHHFRFGYCTYLEEMEDAKQEVASV